MLTTQVVSAETTEKSPTHGKKLHGLHVKAKHLLGNSFLKPYHIICRLILMSTVIVQFALIDYYIVTYKGNLWSLIAIPDVAVLVLFTVMIVLSYRSLQKREVSARTSCVYLGEFPLTYITWFIYAASLSSKICLLYVLPDESGASIAMKLKETLFFGPNMLRTAVSLCSLVLFMMVLSSHDMRVHSPQNAFIVNIIGSAYVDLLDNSQFLGFLRDEHRVISKFGMNHGIVAILCFNFILPTEALIILAQKRFGKKRVSNRFQLLHKIIYFIIANLPLFIIRMLVWHLQDQNVSVFLVKNLLALGFALRDIHEFTLDVNEVIRTELHIDDVEMLECEGGLRAEKFDEEGGGERDEKAECKETDVFTKNVGT